jgi:hypothetical protein
MIKIMLGKEQLKRCKSTCLEAWGGGRRRGKPFLGGLLGKTNSKPPIAQRAEL